MSERTVSIPTPLGYRRCTHENAYSKLGSISQNHNPVLARLVPQDFGIAKLRGCGRNHRILRVRFERVASVPADGDVLILYTLNVVRVLRERIHSYLQAEEYDR